MTTSKHASTGLLDRALRILTVVGVIALGAIGLALPESPLRGGVSWLAFLFFALSGHGYLVVRAAKVPDVDVGLRALLGTCGYLTLAGLGLMGGLLTRPIVLGLISLGVAGFAWRELVTAVPSWERVRDGLRFVRSRPQLGLLVIAMAAFAIVQLVGAVATLDRSPWDDDLAYTPLVKRLLDTGDLIEPFSFRRLGAYGGQTVLQALGGARGSLANIHLIDKGLCFGLTLLLVLGHARRVRTQPLWTMLVVFVLLLLPDTALNTASYWSGVAMFVGLFRLVSDERWALAGLVGGATCTLRQNYIAIAVVFLAIVLLARLWTAARSSSWRTAWQTERTCWWRSAGIAAVVLIPYCIAAFRSNHTFLFPFMEGTFNTSVSLRATAVSWIDELQYLFWCLLEATPIVIVPSVFAVIVFTSDARPGRPILALLLASTFGFVLMVHSFVGSDANHLWRYGFAAAVTLLTVFSLEVGGDDDGPLRIAPLGRWVLLGSLLIQLLVSRGAIAKRYAALFDNLREARVIDLRGDPVADAERRRYAALQAAIPRGARVAIMLDDPAFLDFGRHDVANLDTPGYASPSPGLPAFAGAEAVRAYLLGQGIRFVAFVRSERSHHFYRRPFWVWRIFNDAEVFQVMSAYAIDAIDAFAELATKTTVLHDVDGLVALDLGSEPPPTPVRTDRPESARRSAFVRALAEREGLHDAWSLNSRDNVLFEDGFTGLVFLDGRTDDPTWYEVLHPPSTAPTRGTAARWMYRRAHVRLRGDADMRLVLRGKVNLAATHARPRLDVSLGGELLTSVVVDDAGRFAIEVTVSHAQLGAAWRDLYLVFHGVSEPAKDARDQRAARLESLEWEPR